MTTRRGLAGTSDKLLTILATTNQTTIATRERGRVYSVLRVVNANGSAVVLDVVVNDGTTDFYQVKSKSLATNEQYDLELHGLALANGETIKATADTANALHLTLFFDDETAR